MNDAPTTRPSGVLILYEKHGEEGEGDSDDNGDCRVEGAGVSGD